MHDKVIDEITGMVRQFHRLIDPRTTAADQVVDISALGHEVMRALREIFDPSPEQIEVLRVRINEACAEVMADQKAAVSHGSVH